MGSLITPGFHSDQSVYCSEINGVYVMMVVLDSICSVWDIPSGGVTLGCDGNLTLRQALEIQSITIKSTQQNFDLLIRI